MGGSNSRGVRTECSRSSGERVAVPQSRAQVCIRLMTYRKTLMAKKVQKAKRVKREKPYAGRNRVFDMSLTLRIKLNPSDRLHGRSPDLPHDTSSQSWLGYARSQASRVVGGPAAAYVLGNHGFHRNTLHSRWRRGSRPLTGFSVRVSPRSQISFLKSRRLRCRFLGQGSGK